MTVIRLCSIVAFCCLAGLVVSSALSFGLKAAESADSGTLRIDPPASTVAVGSTVSVNVVQNASVATGGAQADVVFPPASLHLQSVSAGPSYSGASLVAGVAPQTVQNAIDESNLTGTLKNL